MMKFTAFDRINYLMNDYIKRPNIYICHMIGNDEIMFGVNLPAARTYIGTWKVSCRCALWEYLI